MTGNDSGTPITNTMNERVVFPNRRLGKSPAKASRKSLFFADFEEAPEAPPPPVFDFWRRRVGFSLDTYGNTGHGCCTRASQAHLARRMERIEQRHTINFTEEEVLRVYYAMTERLYGGGDTGAYEEDALSEWRKPDLTFRDTRGHPHTIDAFARLNNRNLDELRRALWVADAHGIKMCFNLPHFWARIIPPGPWDVRRTADGSIDLTGVAMPGSWGGHSLTARSYDTQGIYLVHTWGLPDQLVTWDAVAAYCDEAHLVVDSVNTWRTRRAPGLNLDALVLAVNAVSGQKIRA